MNQTRMKVFLSALTLAATCSAQTAVYGHTDKYLLPDRSVTPGAVNPALVADPSRKSIVVGGLESNICAVDFSTAPYKKSTDAVKQQVCEKYGGKDCLNSSEAGINYLIPLELGGRDAINNLWWVPDPDYSTKTKLDRTLKSMVCSGRISLSQAQGLVQHNWVNGMWGTQILQKCEKCTMTIAPNIQVPKSSTPK